MSDLDASTDVSERFAADFHKIGVVKCGSFKLKTGMDVPVYFDFRVVISFPNVLSRLAEELAHRIDVVFGRDSFDVICGVPYTALPFSVLAAQHLNAPLVVKRKEAKNYGTMNLIDGQFKAGDRCIIIEDTVTSGTSIIEVVQALETSGLRVVGVVALLDREQGGAFNLSKMGLNCTFLFKASELLEALEKTGHLDGVTVKSVIEFLRANHVPIKANTTAGTVASANGSAKNGVEKVKEVAPCSISIGRRLFDIMKSKKSNLCLAADVETCKELLDVADLLGPYICALKTHVDGLGESFDNETAQRLTAIARKHNFLIIEDRKLADIGNTSKRIFSRICQWADMVTVHALPGIDQIRAMASARLGKPCGVLLIVQMSCDGNLITPDYTKASIDMARQFPGFVAGAIAQDAKILGGLQMVQCNNSFAIFTPGVSLSSKEDAVGQRYSTPEKAIRERGTDVVIVGRGILDSYTGEAGSVEATINAAENYRAAAWIPYKDCHAYELG